MKFPCIKNVAVDKVEMRTLWKVRPRVPKFKKKRDYKDWLAQPSTEHCLFSGFMGTIPDLRINSKINPIYSMHALVADFDAKISEEEFQSMVERAGDACPNWVSETPSHGARLVWILDRPVLISTVEILDKTLRMASKALDIKGLLPGFDFQDAFLNPTIYYDIGMNWVEVEGASPLPASLIEGWMIKSSRGAKWEGVAIPLDVIEKKMHEEYPGRWEGPFDEGSRGVRFWDPMADNPTGAVVRPTGMQCFTGPFGFMTWSKIFSGSFVEQYTTKKIGGVVEGVWYDGKTYWYQSADDKWEGRAEKEMNRWLKVDSGLSSIQERGTTFSEVDQALHMIDQHCRVAGAAPFVYLPPGMIDFQGKRVLNTARVKPLTAADDIHDWGDRFPWISNFLENFFDSEEQLIRFICWLKRFYVSAVDGQPLQGQAIFIAGDAGQGKTLLSNKIVSGLVGGHQDAAQFLLGASSFNKELFHNGLWTVDDATPGDSAADHKKFSSLLKKVTANTTFEYSAKFHDAVMVEWTGRVIITGNLDAESLRILPDLETSILDKLMLFKAATIDKKFPPRHELESTIAKELPYLAAFLTEFEMPSECLSHEQRYGILSYHHPELRCAAGETTDAAVLEEIINTWIAERMRNKETIPWVGTATAFMQEIFLDEVLRSVVGRNSARWFGIQLGKLEAQRRGVKSERHGNKKIYTVFGTDDPAAETWALV